MRAVLDGLVAEDILTAKDLELVDSTFLIHAGHAYPIPSVDRDEALAVIQGYLEQHEIYSRGRFGSWKYEIGNQDHSLMQGVELVDRWLDGTEEKVFKTVKAGALVTLIGTAFLAVLVVIGAAALGLGPKILRRPRDRPPVAGGRSLRRRWTSPFAGG